MINLKIRTFGIMFFSCLLLVAGVFAGILGIIRENIIDVEAEWSEFRRDQSEKARLEGVMRAAIGYGGMVHQFKNFVLRQDVERMDTVQEHLGAASLTVKQFSSLGTTEDERIALDDIEAMLEDYGRALFAAQTLAASGKSPEEIDRAVRVDDRLALRGLRSLRLAVKGAEHDDRSGRNGGSGSTDSGAISRLRASLGYGGMIHEFKNYILRQDAERVDRVLAKLTEAEAILVELEKRILSPSEGDAIEDIKLTLRNYRAALEKATQMAAEGRTAKQIDAAVRVDDTLALRGLAALDRHVVELISRASEKVTASLAFVDRTAEVSIFITLGLVGLLGAVFSGLMQSKIIKPIRELTNTMHKLADGDLSAEVSRTGQSDEIGQMARSVAVFKENALKKTAADEELKSANEALNARLAEVEDFRDRTEAQAMQAVQLAEDLELAKDKAEQAVRGAEMNETRMRGIVENVVEGILTLDPEGKIDTYNVASQKMFGYDAEECVGMNISVLLSATDDDGGSRRFDLHDCIGKRQDFIGRHRDGNTFPVEFALGEMRLGDEVMYTGVIRDVTEQRKAEETIRKLAMTDTLTGLSNRNHFETRLEESIALAKRQKSLLALMLLDLDKFKPVNDTYGHPVGDELLKRVADILTGTRRNVDTVARLGGDEFALIVVDVNDAEAAAGIAARIVDDLSNLFVVGGREIQIGGSIGISLADTGDESGEELIRRADVALYAVKNAGRNGYRCYARDMEKDRRGGRNKKALPLPDEDRLRA